MTSYTKNQTILRAGEPFSCFHIITEGSVAAVYASSETARAFTLKKGDVIGIFDFTFKEYSFTYKALENTSLISYSLQDFSELGKLMDEHKEITHFLVLSMIHNASRVAADYHALCSQQENFYYYMISAVSNYQKFCLTLGLPAKTLANKEQLQPYTSGQEEPPFWQESFYQSLKAPALEHNPIFFNAAFVVGLLARFVGDVHKILYCSEDISAYLHDLGQLLINETSLDLFDLYTDLLFRARNAGKDTDSLQKQIQDMISLLKNYSFIDSSLVSERVARYEAEYQRDHSYDIALEESLPQIEKKLIHSVNTILDYADILDTTRQEFLKYLDAFKNLSDKNSIDKSAETIRRQLTRLFNTIYTEVFQIALHDPTPPIVIKMFLHFGYMDMELAGLNNAAYLYSIAGNYQGDPENGIYTLYEWITAVYEGKKHPCRNELSQDYSTYVHILRTQGKIDAAAEQNMLTDTHAKVMYELENMFPSVNKITQGHFSTYCPIFLQENVVKDLSSILTTSYKVKEALQKILAVDFSAFYRSSLYVNEALNLRENILSDIHPDFIIMPNVGSNGICWQEIEGMQRSTPARMMLSAFHAENLDKTMTQMVGDFRWEMCRRIQGVRWNDITEHSLTSEYYDYALFYSKNRELSQDAREKTKLALARAKNNYKNLFVMDYVNWIQYESKGSVKLNKVVRRIFSLYIPFRTEICANLMSNNTFTESLQVYDLKKKQKLFRLRKLVQKYQALGKTVPEPLIQHIELLDQ